MIFKNYVYRWLTLLMSFTSGWQRGFIKFLFYIKGGVSGQIGRINDFKGPDTCEFLNPVLRKAHLEGQLAIPT